MSATATHPPLPAGYAERVPSSGDAEQLYGLIHACQVADHGEAYVDREDIVSDWRHPSLDLAADTRFVIDPTGDVVGYAEVFTSRADCYVLPPHRGRGVGSWIAAWVERRAREQGAAFVSQVAGVDNRVARDLLERSGYRQTYDSWVFGVRFDDLPGGIPPVVLPPGITVRDYVPGDADDHATWRVIEDAFAPWPNREPNPLGGWRALTVERDGFEPWMLPLLVRGDDVVAAAYCIDCAEEGEVWVQQIAVCADLRGQGLGTALLHEVFARFAERGRGAAGLSTDSRTGARGLYERVGMTVRSQSAGYALQLR